MGFDSAESEVKDFICTVSRYATLLGFSSRHRHHTSRTCPPTVFLITYCYLKFVFDHLEYLEFRVFIIFVVRIIAAAGSVAVVTFTRFGLWVCIIWLRVLFSLFSLWFFRSQLSSELESELDFFYLQSRRAFHSLASSSVILFGKGGVANAVLCCRRVWWDVYLFCCSWSAWSGSS